MVPLPLFVNAIYLTIGSQIGYTLLGLCSNFVSLSLLFSQTNKQTKTNQKASSFSVLDQSNLCSTKRGIVFSLLARIVDNIGGCGGHDDGRQCFRLLSGGGDHR